MTRQEAIKVWAETYRKNLCDPEVAERNAGIDVDGFVALGMLNLDEPKSVEDRAHDAMRNLTGSIMASEVLFVLHQAGLKIVEADK